MLLPTGSVTELAKIAKNGGEGSTPRAAHGLTPYVFFLSDTIPLARIFSGTFMTADKLPAARSSN
jgi:hypothetical protein